MASGMQTAVLNIYKYIYIWFRCQDDIMKQLLREKNKLLRRIFVGHIELLCLLYSLCFYIIQYSVVFSFTMGTIIHTIIFVLKYCRPIYNKYNYTRHT